MTAVRPAPDATAWARVSALFDTGSEVPRDLREDWLESLSDDEPVQVIEWLRDMLDDAGEPGAEDPLERGPRLPDWSESPAGSPAEAAPAAPQGPTSPGSAPARASSPATQDGSAAEFEARLARALESEGKSEGKSEPEPEPESESESEGEGEVPPESRPETDTEIEPESESGLELEPESESDLRLAAPVLLSGMRLGPWLLLALMNSSAGRASQWRARLATDDANGREVVLLVPDEWRFRRDLAGWLAHVAARPLALVHPHIARLVAVGVTKDGTPWLATELAEGNPIDRWCQPLTLHDRQALLEQALAAMSFAHARLVLHGQIHPSQILVTPAGRVRWLNFGVGELLDLLETPPAAEAPGAAGPPTRAYAAPEQQAGATAGPFAAASAAGDIHAFGLVLFEVLAGASPWQPRTPGIAPPTAAGSRWPRPSNLAATLRQRVALRGDLDAIVVKALQTDPAQRYGSAAELLDDLKRSRAKQPVAAVQGGLGYEMSRLAARRPLWSTALLVLAAALVSAVGALSWKTQTVSIERDRSLAARSSGESVTRLMHNLLHESTQPGAGRDWPRLLAHAESVARSSLKEQPASLAGALALLGRSHAERGAFAEGRNLLAEALPLLTDPMQKLEAECDEAWAQARQVDKPDEAELRLRRVTENKAARPGTRALCMARLADVERRSGRIREAHQSGFDAREQWEKSAEKAPQLALLLARPMGALSVSLGRFHQAQTWFEWALTQLEMLQQGTGPVGTELRAQWSEASLAAGDAQRAVALADTNLVPLAGAALPAEADVSTAPPAAFFYAAAEPRVELHLLAEARARLERTIALADARDELPMRQRARCQMAVLALRERDAAAAERWLKSVPAEGPRRRAFDGAPAATLSGTDTAGKVPGLMTPLTAEDEAREAARTAARDADHLCRVAAAELALQQGRHLDVQREADRLLSAGDNLSPRQRAAVTLMRAESALAAGQPDRAVGAALQALQQARALHQSDVGDEKAQPSFRSGQAALVLAEAQRASGDTDAATKALDYALQQLGATLPQSHPWRRRAEATKAAFAAPATKKP